MSRLARSDPSTPGISRRRRGSGFSYVNVTGKPLSDDEALARIRSLVIPPAWSDVWICPRPNGHIQAVGTDQEGRRQYLYHLAWRESRDQEKFDRSQSLGKCLPQIRRTMASHLRKDGLGQQQVLTCAVRLIDLGLFRVGSEHYARRNNSYGLATLRRDHVYQTANQVRFEFPAKSGQLGQMVIREPRVVRMVSRLLKRDDRSPELLAWRDDVTGEWVDVKSRHVNEHIRTLTGADLTAKDFRTWHATVLMAEVLARRLDDEPSARQFRRVVVDSYRAVADALGNTPAVARSSYVDPRVVDLAEQGKLIPLGRSSRHEIVTLNSSSQVLQLLKA